MSRKIVLQIWLVLVLAGWAIAAGPESPVTIMTQNMDAGTDQSFVVAALLRLDDITLQEAVDLTFLEVAAGMPGRRAGLIAAKIADRKPDLVALQEVSLWRVGPSPSAMAVAYDQLSLLLASLEAKGAHYSVVAVNNLTDLTLPGHDIPFVGFTDRDVLLIRSDLRPPAFHLSDVHARTFAASLPLPGVNVTAGWISAIVHMNNKLFRLYATHLSSPVPGVQAATDVQLAQTNQLIYEMRNSAIPVVLCGDFNSDALHGGHIDDTPSVDMIHTAGYSEVWPAVHPGDPGKTWPIYSEDNPPPFFYRASTALERIDLFFSKGLTVVGAERVLSTAPTPIPTPYGSDHAGVIATFRF